MKKFRNSKKSASVLLETGQQMKERNLQHEALSNPTYFFTFIKPYNTIMR